MKAEFLDYYAKSDMRIKLRNLYIENLCNLNCLSEKFTLNSPVENCALYYYCYINGYLSYNHTFTYDMEVARSIPLLIDDFGFLISSGYGVCRNISFQLRDFLRIKNIKSFVANTDLKEFTKSPRMIAFFVNLFSTGDHTLNYIKDKRESFLYDPTNNIFPSIVDHSLLRYPNSKIKPVWIISSINDGFLTIIKKQSEDKIKEIREKYQQQLNVFDSNKDILEKFYQENKDIYQEMNSKLSKVKEKKLY